MKITFSGDVYVETPINKFSLSSELKDIYNNSNFNFATLEAPIASKSLTEYPKIGPNLRQDSSIKQLLPFFTHVSVANNHIMDYGYEGCLETISFLQEQNIVPIGVSDKYPDMYYPVVLDKNGVKVAVFCWGEAQYGCCKSEVEGKGYAWALNPMTYGLIAEYKKKVDHVIVFVHAGLEDVEYPLVDWRMQYKAYVDYGADLVVASHPHLIQGKEKYKNKMIYYSLGNLFFNGKYSSDLQTFTNSLIVSCDISKEAIQCTETFVNFSKNKIEISLSHIKDNFDKLTWVLKEENDEEYTKLHNQMILDCWNEYYKSYYSFPIWKDKINVPFHKRLFNDLMEKYTHRCFLPPISLNKLYHNVNIDTHRFVVSRVCGMLSNTY